MTESHVPKQLVLVWVGLMALTAASRWLGEAGGPGDVQSASALLLVIAFAKARFVGRFFMDLRDAPCALRWGFDAWCVLVAAMLLVLYLG